MDTGQFFSLRTSIHLSDRIEREVSCREEPGPGAWTLPAVEAIIVVAQKQVHYSYEPPEFIQSAQRFAARPV